MVSEMCVRKRFIRRKLFLIRKVKEFRAVGVGASKEQRDGFPPGEPVSGFPVVRPRLSRSRRIAPIYLRIEHALCESRIEAKISA